MKSSTNRTPRPKGIALIVSLLAILILSIIVATFINAYRSHYSLNRSSASSQIAGAGCDSIYEYISYRLEHDKDWGASAFSGGSSGDPLGPILDIFEVPNTHTFTGTMADLNVEFEGKLYNNISGAGDTESAARARPGTVLCEVVCKNGTSTRRAEFVLSVAPLFDSSVLSRADLKVDANTLKMRSLDPNRNFLRAEGDIYVPDMLDASNSRFLMPNTTNTLDKKGMLWAKGDIYSYGGGGPELVGGNELPTATRNSGGKIVSRADSHFSIYDLKEDQLDISTGLVTVPVPAGRWNFVRQKAKVTYNANYNKLNKSGGRPVGGHNSTATVTEQSEVWVDVLEYYDDPDATVPSKVFRSEHRTDDIVAQIPNEVTGKGWKKDVWGLNSSNPVETTNVDVIGYDTPVQLNSSGKLVFGTEGAGSLVFDMTNQRVTADFNSKIEVDGPFHITSDSIPLAETDSMGLTPPPTLDLGFNATGTSKAAILAKDDIEVSGGVTVGLGALVSKRGDVTIQPKNSSSVAIDSTEANTGLMIYAGGDVHLKNPDATGDWDFKGLVYARGGVKMEGSNSEDVRFEGTIVSLQENPPEDGGQGGIEFENTKDVEFVYNAELLDDFVRNLPGQRIQLENVVWKG